MWKARRRSGARKRPSRRHIRSPLRLAFECDARRREALRAARTRQGTQGGVPSDWAAGAGPGEGSHRHGSPAPRRLAARCGPVVGRVVCEGVRDDQGNGLRERATDRGRQKIVANRTARHDAGPFAPPRGHGRFRPNGAGERRSRLAGLQDESRKAQSRPTGWGLHLEKGERIPRLLRFARRRRGGAGRDGLGYQRASADSTVEHRPNSRLLFHRSGRVQGAKRFFRTPPNAR